MEDVIKVKRLYRDSKLPILGTDGAGGADLSAQEDVNISPGAARLVPTGLSMAIPKGQVGILKDRSGLSKNHYLEVLAGVIDSDYRGEINALIFNNSKVNYEVRKGDRICQMVVVYCNTKFREYGGLDETIRGENGFGSTGRS